MHSTDVKYDEIAVERPLVDYIQKFWVLDNSHSPLLTEGKYALPNGCFTIALISGNGVVIENKDKITAVNAEIYLVGQISNRVKIAVRPYTKAIMVQLKPWAPALITNFPLHEATNQVIDFSLINKDMHTAFTGIDLSDKETVIRTFYREFANYLYPTNDSNFVRFVFHQLQTNTLNNPVRVSDIASLSGYSQRRVEQKFNQLIGLSPKEVQKILQLRVLINELSVPNSTTLSYLTHKYGYYDQSHFIKSYSKIMYDLPANFSAGNYILPFH